MRLQDFFDDAAHDLRYAVRGLRRRPAFTAIAVLTLAIGIGATTSIFSAVNVLLIRQLPYAKPDELMKVSLTVPAAPGRTAREDLVWSYPKFTAFRNAQQVFADLSLYSSSQYTVTSGDVELIRGEQVGATYLRTLGVVPARGRDFERTVDDHPNAERQTIISRAFWERRYNADPDIVGKTIDLDGKPFTIIGITPDGFAGLTGRAEVFVPITTRSAEDLSEIDSHEFYALGRRKAGVTLGAAVSAVSALGKPIHDAFAQSRMGGGWTIRARPLEDARVAPLVRRSLLVLFGAVGFVLLIACVNVANLLLGRASARRQEIAVRLAIGAARARLIRLLVTESLVLAALGGVASLVVALLATRALAAINPAVMLRAAGLGGFGAVAFASIRLDWSALAFTFGITLVVGLVFGLLPALHATRTSLVDSIKGSGSEIRASAARRLLVVGEVALALVLLAGSGLMIRSLSKLLSIHTGFDGRNVLTLRLTIPPGGLARDSMPGFYDQLLERLRAVPGVSDVALNNCPPLAGGCNGTRLERMDLPEDDPARAANGGGVHWATSTWFATLRVPVKQGRTFARTDRVGAPKVLVLNETAALTLFPHENPLGKRVGVGQGGFGDGAEVIGVVGDVRQVVDSAAKPEVYIPYLQSPRPGMMIFVRTQHDPTSVTADVRRALHEVAPRFPAYDI
ncbi:MAG TPA: ADOP family duplicated permease, partial [Gemmatimonadaceae bacterium]